VLNESVESALRLSVFLARRPVSRLGATDSAFSHLASDGVADAHAYASSINAPFASSTCRLPEETGYLIQ